MRDSTHTDSCLSDDILVALLEQPDEPTLAAARLHAENCERCFVLWAEVHRALASTHDPPRSALLAQRYELLVEIGRGGMGVVYRARDRRLDRDVAVKVLHGGPETRSDENRRRLLDESKVMAQLRHPNVVTIYDVLFEPDRAYVVMEFVQGQTLRSWRSQTSRGSNEVFAVFESIGAGLAAAHRLGIVHRDFKPDNVLIDDEGRPLITDFGLARLIEPDEGSAPEAASIPSPASSRRAGGTLAYAPPEQLLAGAPVDARSDVFTFCVSLWEALSTMRPFPERSLRGRLKAIQRGLVIDPPPGTIRRRVQAVLQRGLAPRPEDRPDSIPLLLRQLRRARRRPAIPAALGLGALSLASALAWWVVQPTPDTCVSSSIAGEAIVLDLDRFESSLQDGLAGMGTLVAADARTKAVELRTAIELTAERTCHEQMAGHLSPVEARARAYCLRALEVQLHTVITRTTQNPNALTVLLEVSYPTRCEAWSGELKAQSPAGRVRSTQDQALADALARIRIGNMLDSRTDLEAAIGPLLDQARASEDRWLHGQALHLAARLSSDRDRSRALSLRASDLFEHAGDPIGQIDALILATASTIDDERNGPDVSNPYWRSRELYERLQDPAASPAIEVWLGMIEMLLAYHRGAQAEARAIAERVRQASPKVSPMTRYFVVNELIMFDELDGNYESMVRASETLIDWLEGHGVFALNFRAEAELTLSSSLLQLGRRDEAEAAWSRANAIMESRYPGEPWPSALALARARIDATTDRLPEGLALLESLREQVAPDHVEGQEIRALQADILLRMDQQDEALAIVETLGAIIERFEPPSRALHKLAGRPNGLNIVTVMAEVHRRRGELDRARDLLELQAQWNMEHYPHAFRSMRAALVQAWVDSDRGELDTAHARFESLESAIPNPYEAAWATVGRIVTGTRAGNTARPHIAAIERARETLRTFPLSYRYELGVIDAWLVRYADELRDASSPSSPP